MAKATGHKTNGGIKFKIDEPYPTSPKGYTVYEKIGRGAFAKVYAAKVNGRKGEEVAIKVLDVSADDPNWDVLIAEISILRELRHENVIDVYTSFSNSDTLWIVTPLMGPGSCADIMKTKYQKGFEDEIIVSTILHAALSALVYMHGLSKVHRDVKAGNILISSKGEIKLADFGVSRTMLDGGQIGECKTFTGSPCWMAPEVMEQSDGYDAKADIWSFGITAMELAFGRAPYSNFKPMKIILLTLQEDPPTIDIYEDSSRKISKDFKRLITTCLKKNPKERPNSEELLKNRFFKKSKGQDYVVEKLIKNLDKKDLFKTKVDLVTERSFERKEDARPVSFRDSFVFTCSKSNLKDIKAGKITVKNIGRFTVETQEGPEHKLINSIQEEPDQGEASSLTIEEGPASVTTAEEPSSLTTAKEPASLTIEEEEPPATIAEKPALMIPEKQIVKEPTVTTPIVKTEQQLGRFRVTDLGPKEDMSDLEGKQVGGPASPVTVETQKKSPKTQVIGRFSVQN